MRTRKDIKSLNAIVFAYILNAIDGENYGQVFTEDQQEDKVNFVYQCFLKGYGHEIKRQKGNEQAAFREWLMGLPSVIGIDFENYRILEIAKEWGSLPHNATEREEDKILANWFNYIANKFFVLKNRLQGKGKLKELEQVTEIPVIYSIKKNKNNLQ